MIDSLSPDLVSCTQAIYSHGGEKIKRRWRNRLTRSLDSSGPVLLVKYPAIVKKRNNRN